MNDDNVLAAVRDCLTAARDSVAGEQMARPVRDIIARGRRRRLRHGLAAVTTAVATAAVIAAIAVPGNGPNGAIPARLAAWTVTTKPGGMLTVTIRELRDPVGLQRRLRADGVPATVRFTGRTAGCRAYPLPLKQSIQLSERIFPRTSNASGKTAFTINPAAIPEPFGVWIDVTPPTPLPSGQRGTYFMAFFTLVYADGHCHQGKPGQTFTGRGGP